MNIDLNCDLGEGSGNDKLIMPFISSANIACGYHAGNVETIIETVLLAKNAGVAIGAHPSFPDRENFGRVEMKVEADKLYELVRLQIEFLFEICQSANTMLTHVKPHGALYNIAARDAGLAKIIAEAVKDVDPTLALFGLSGSRLITEGKSCGLKTYNEVFADRTYQDDGSLTPRSHPTALINDRQQAVDQAIRMVKTGTVITLSGKTIPVIADTICLHGDGPHAVEFAKGIGEAMQKENINIRFG